VFLDRKLRDTHQEIHFRCRGSRRRRLKIGNEMRRSAEPDQRGPTEALERAGVGAGLGRGGRRRRAARRPLLAHLVYVLLDLLGRLGRERVRLVQVREDLRVVQVVAVDDALAGGAHQHLLLQTRPVAAAAALVQRVLLQQRVFQPGYETRLDQHTSILSTDASWKLTPSRIFDCGPALMFSTRLCSLICIGNYVCSRGAKLVATPPSSASPSAPWGSATLSAASAAKTGAAWC